MGSKADSYYMEKALAEIQLVIEYSRGKTYQELIVDSKTLDATLFRMIQLVEQIKNISPSFKEKHPEIPWGDIIGFRNGIVHEYGKTDYTTVYEIVTKDIYQLKEIFEKSLPSK